MNTDDIVDIVDILERCFTSTNVADKSFAPANMVDRAARNLGRLAHAITPTDAAPMIAPGGGRVGRLTEAVIYAADTIAAAIGDLASAVRERDA